MSILFQHNDGGRVASGKFKSTNSVSDCGCRSLAIALGVPYMTAYKTINNIPPQGKNKSSARNGLYKEDMDYILFNMGWKWVFCKNTHLCTEELPKSGTIIVRLSKHYATVIDGVLHDSYDCSRNGTRKVYGYWIKDDSQLPTCPNCKDHIEIFLTADKRYPFVGLHNTQGCPFGLETHQKTKADVIKSYIDHINNKFPWRNK